MPFLFECFAMVIFAIKSLGYKAETIFCNKQLVMSALETYQIAVSILMSYDI